MTMRKPVHFLAEAFSVAPRGLSSDPNLQSKMLGSPEVGHISRCLAAARPGQLTFLRRLEICRCAYVVLYSI